MTLKLRGKFYLGGGNTSLQLNPFMDDGVSYLLLDRFTTDLAAGAVNGTPATPGPGTRTVADTNSKLSIAGGLAVFATGGVAANDPRLAYASVTRVFGLAVLATVTPKAGASASIQFGLGTNATNAVDLIEFSASGVLSLRENNSALRVVGAFVDNTAYQLCIVQRAAGVGGFYAFIKGGAFTNWTLLWVSLAGTANRTPGLQSVGTTPTSTVDNFRIPVALYVPVPLAYDTFTRANAALGNSETAGPDAQAVTARAWTGATFAVAGNVAVNTPTLGADVIVNGGFAADTDWTKGSNWSIAAGVATAVAATSNLTAAVAPGVLGTWYQTQFTISGYAAGNLRIRLDTPGTHPSHAADGTFTETARELGTGFVLFASAYSGNVDNVSAKPLTLSELLASLSVSTPDVIADVNVTGPTATAGIQAGLVVNLDSAASPANFVIAYLDGNGNAKLEKCVAGVYTSVISAAVTYSAGAVLRVIKSGTSYSLFYNSLAVGVVSTISDAGIISNTLHGLFSTSPLNSLDAFQIFPRGTSGEFEGLSAF